MIVTSGDSVGLGGTGAQAPLYTQANPGISAHDIVHCLLMLNTCIFFLQFLMKLDPLPSVSLSHPWSVWEMVLQHRMLLMATMIL